MTDDWEPDCKLVEVARTEHYLIARVRPARPPADVMNAVGSERLQARAEAKLLEDLEAQLERGYRLVSWSHGRLVFFREGAWGFRTERSR